MYNGPTFREGEGRKTNEEGGREGEGLYIKVKPVFFFEGVKGTVRINPGLSAPLGHQE